MVFPSRSKASAFTLVEILVGMLVASLIVMVLVSLMFFFSRSVSSLTSFSYQSTKDRLAAQYLAEDIREANSFDSLSATNISLIIATQIVSFAYLADSQELYRLTAGTNGVVTSSHLLLSNCREFEFSFFEWNRDAGDLEDLLVSTSAACRIIQADWQTVISEQGEEWVETNSVRFFNRRL